MSQNESSSERSKGMKEMNQVFARVEEVGGRLALAGISIAFLLYLFGILPPIVPLEDLPSLIGNGAANFARDNGVPTGWGFLQHLGNGDMLSLGAMMLLIVVVFAAYLMLIPRLLRSKDFLYLILVVLQLVVFVVAGGGWLGGGGH